MDNRNVNIRLDVVSRHLLESNEADNALQQVEIFWMNPIYQVIPHAKWLLNGRQGQENEEVVEPVVIGGMVLDIHATTSAPAKPRTTTPGKVINRLSIFVSVFNSMF